MIRKGGLGKGLGALIPTYEVEPQEGDAIKLVSVLEIQPNPYQPRRDFDIEKLQELVESIRIHGVIQPLIVRMSEAGNHQLVAGERRWRAAREAGLTEVPCVVREYSDLQISEIALIENLQRQELNPIEEAIAFKRLMEEFQFTQEEVAEKIGRSRSLIANTLRLLNLPKVIQEFVSRGTFTMGHAKPMLSISDPELQLAAANYVVSEELSVRDTEEYVRRLLTSPVAKPKEKKNEKRELPVVQAEEKLRLVLGTQVKIKTGKVKSRIEIEYYSEDDLQRILDTIGLGEFN